MPIATEDEIALSEVVAELRRENASLRENLDAARQALQRNADISEETETKIGNKERAVRTVWVSACDGIDVVRAADKLASGVGYPTVDQASKQSASRTCGCKDRKVFRVDITVEREVAQAKEDRT